MKWLGRASGIPEDVRKLAGDERVLAWARTSDDRLLVATPTGLWWPDRRSGESELLHWWRINKAVWREGVLSVIAADADEHLLIERHEQTVVLEEPGAVPATIRKRVEGSIRRTERVRLPAGEVRVVARTVAGQDGLMWRARLEPGSYDNPALREQLAELIAQLTEQSNAALRA